LQTGRFAILPPKGVNPASVDAIQKELLTLGYNAIMPNYHPIVFPVGVQEKIMLTSHRNLDLTPKEGTKYRDQVIKSIMEDGYIEQTIPDKLTSSKQKYRLTQQGREILRENKNG